jgi:hypothetical protein
LTRAQLNLLVRYSTPEDDVIRLEGDSDSFMQIWVTMKSGVAQMRTRFTAMVVMTVSAEGLVLTAWWEVRVTMFTG